MRIRITVGGKVVNTVDFKTEKKVSCFNYIRRLEAMQQTEDVLKIGKLGNADFGIKSLTEKDGVTTNANIANTSNVQHSNGNFVMGIDVGKDMQEAQNLTIDGENMGVKVRLDMYEPGWVLNTGKKSSNIFGGSYSAYRKNIGRRNVKSGVKNGAKVFATQKAVIAYIEKNQEVMKCCVQQYGYQWSMEFTCDLFGDEYEAELIGITDKKRTKTVQETAAITSLLDCINEAIDEPEEQEELPEEVTAETIKAEAVKRMEKLNILGRVIGDFKRSSKIYMSEYGGALYNLDEKAEIAVKRVCLDEKTPYHVIVTETTFGKCYAVLYVSSNTENWEYERPDRDGIMATYVYNADDPMCSEYVDSLFISANGGLKRVA